MATPPNNQASWLQNLAYGIGNLIDSAPGPRNSTGTLFNSGIDISSKLMRTPQVYASETSYPSSSGVTGSWGGDVLGASTTASPTGQSSSTTSGDSNAGQPGYYQNEFGQWVPESGGSSGPSREDIIRSMFDEAIGNLGGQQTEQNTNITNIANTQKSGIDEQVAAMDPQYGIYKQNINTQGNKSLADLAAEMRAASQNMVNFLGGKNAGNTSAVPGVAYALSKEFGKNRANVMSQVGDQLSQVDLAQANLKAKAVEMKNQVDTWANSQIASIAQQFQNMRGQLDMGKRNAILDYLGQIEDQRRQLITSIQTQGMERLQQLNDMKLQLQNSGNFNPQDIMAGEFTFNPQTNQYATDFANAIFGPRKDENQV